MKVKTLCTLYRDYNEDYIEIESPKLWKEYYRVGEHYDYIQKGTILNVFTLREYYEDEYQSNTEIVLTEVSFLLNKYLKSP